jgi:hypothetical protein
MKVFRKNSEKISKLQEYGKDQGLYNSDKSITEILVEYSMQFGNTD